MYNDVLTLVKETYTTNEFGDSAAVETARDVFCEVRSVGMREKYQAQAVGLLPELVFVLADYYEYEDEQKLRYRGKEYRILRTYIKETHEIELVVTRDGSA